MRILELLGQALRPFRSDDSKLLQSSDEVANAPQKFPVTSSAFRDGEKIPVTYTIDGQKLFPRISWSDQPADCRSLLLVIEDPDAPKPTPFIHGILYNIPPSLMTLQENAFSETGVQSSLINAGVRPGKNTLSKAAYMPPSPPPGHGPHHYHFQMIALDTILNLTEAPPTLEAIKDAIHGHVLATGETVGLYEK